MPPGLVIVDLVVVELSASEWVADRLVLGEKLVVIVLGGRWFVVSIKLEDRLNVVFRYGWGRIENFEPDVEAQVNLEV